MGRFMVEGGFGEMCGGWMWVGEGEEFGGWVEGDKVVGVLVEWVGRDLWILVGKEVWVDGWGVDGIYLGVVGLFKCVWIGGKERGR